jgi:hypothetical protein
VLPAILLAGYATNTAELALGGTLSGPFIPLRKPVEGKHPADRSAALLRNTTATRG